MTATPTLTYDIVTDAEVSPDHPPILLAHGLFGQGRNLGGIARRLGRDLLPQRRVITVDLRNHGDSFHDPVHSYPALAGDLLQLIDNLGGTVDLVGHSMGGKAAMWLALTQPEKVRRLAVLDIAPVTYSRGQAEIVDAIRSFDVTGLERRSDADERFSAYIEDAGTRAFLLQSLDLRTNPPRWQINIETLADQMQEIIAFPDAGGRVFDKPTLFLAGTHSRYVRDIHHAQIRALFPQARISQVDAGHWLHAERPDEVAALIGELFKDGTLS